MPCRTLLLLGLLVPVLAACGSNQVDRAATAALTGAAVGGIVGGPIGIAAGGVLGGVAGAMLPQGADQAMGFAPKPQKPG